MITKTWRERSDLANWTWRLPLTENIDGEWAWDIVEQLETICIGFARVSSVALDTLSGDDERRFSLPDELDAARGAVRDSSDFYGIVLDLDLECISPDGEPFLITSGAEIAVSIARTASGQIDCERNPNLVFYLDADIYDFDSPEGDNEAMAAVNGPKLTQFLRRVEAFGAQFTEVEGPYCPGVHRYGFDPPENEVVTGTPR